MTDFIGRTIGDFRLDELIDDAGNASVYRGVQVSTNRAVAIKVLKPEAASNPAALQAFTQYAQTAAGMPYPNILPVLSTGQSEGDYYLVTPYESNRSLAQQKSAYNAPAQVSALFKALAPGLEYIYSQGMVHGNLRPSNIILDAQRQPLLSNIGASFQQGQAPTAYTSPEQRQGLVADRRADIFALGVLLYELLANQVPVPGAAMDLHAVRPDLPPQLDQVIQKATAQNPDQRYQTVSEFTGALDLALQPAPHPTPAPVPIPTQTSIQQEVTVEDKGTNWTGILVGALVVIVLCLVLAVVGPRVAEYLNQQETVSQPLPTEPTPAEAPDEDKSVVIIEKPDIDPPEDEPPPAEQPPVEEPPAAEVPPEAPDAPVRDEPPQDVPTPGGEPAPQAGQQLCSSLGLAGGIVLVPGVFAIRHRKRKKARHPSQ
ncbi:MAG: serine/threonine-protein kinase [Desulfobacterales bacterium]